MTIIYQDTENPYQGERPVHDTGRVQIGITHTRRQRNGDSVTRHRAPMDAADRIVIIGACASLVGLVLIALAGWL